MNYPDQFCFVVQTHHEPNLSGCEGLYSNQIVLQNHILHYNAILEESCMGYTYLYHNPNEKGGKSPTALTLD